MAARRVRGWQPDVPVGVKADPRGALPQHLVTPAVIDEAVEEVLVDQGLDAEKKEVFRTLLATDPTSSVAHAYYAGMSSMGLQQAHVRALRRELSVPYAMTEAQTGLLTAYASEFKLIFRLTDSHDHPLPAAYRVVDQTTVESRVPPGVPYSDLGGSVIRLAMAGNDHGHVCRPLVDRKDPARVALQRLRLRKVSADESKSDVTRRLALAILNADPVHVCDKLAQDCTYQTPVALSVHVYDIAMVDWPAIMEKKGIKLVEGCMLFSNKVFEKSSGVFEAAGVRYEVDKTKGLFNMGFEDSPAWWYSHKLAEYLRYGADQVLRGKSGMYSYKVIERRGDTIFFRIVPVGRGVTPDHKQVYKLPGVKMVRVCGYDAARVSLQDGRPVKEWNWPAPLWEDMVSHAAEQFERNAFQVERMFNYYRSVAPRQTINSVLVSGGYTVEMDELVALVIHASLAGMMQVVKEQLTLKAVLSSAMARRTPFGKSGMAQLAGAFAVVAHMGFSYVCARASQLVGWLANPEVELDDAFVSEWEPVVQVRLMPAQVVLAKSWRAGVSWGMDHKEHDFGQAVRAVAPMDLLISASRDPAAASVVLDIFDGSLPADVLKRLEEQKGRLPVRDDVDGTDAVSGGGYAETVTSTRPGTSSSSTGGAEPGGQRQSGDVVSARVAAIHEAIAEVEMERRQVESSCGSAFLDLMVEGQPSEHLCRTRAEAYYNPDFWYVVAGRLTKSLLGRTPAEFEQSAVYSPRADTSTGSRLRPVMSEFYEGKSRGGDVDREYCYITDSHFTGWVYTSDILVIYNGPEIVEALKIALTKDLGFEVVLQQGPPGCGKTTAIVQTLQAGEMVLGAVRMSVKETRGRVQEKRPKLNFPVKTRVRTLDSYLVNYSKQVGVRKLSADVVRADEVFMSHAGKWYAAAALLGCSRAYVYGDRYQIPHVPRAAAPCMHVRIRSTAVNETWITYRCPADAVAAWGDVYDWRVRSVSAVRLSLSQVATAKGLPIPRGCVMMGMYQADKKEIARLYAGCGVPIQVMTVHESQGNTYAHVRLHRFDNRMREKADKTSLYDRQEYALVAMSRHTESFTYVRPSTVKDEVTRRCQQGKLARRINAAAESATAGEPKQYI